VAMARKYVRYSKLSMSVVDGPREASCTIAFCWVIPTTVVSTKLSSGSLSQMRMVVEAKMMSCR
jgi:hypothetical protein